MKCMLRSKGPTWSTPRCNIRRLPPSRCACPRARRRLNASAVPVQARDRDQLAAAAQTWTLYPPACAFGVAGSPLCVAPVSSAASTRLFGSPSSLGLLALWNFVLAVALWGHSGWAQVYRCGNTTAASHAPAAERSTRLHVAGYIKSPPQGGVDAGRARFLALGGAFCCAACPPAPVGGGRPVLTGFRSAASTRSGWRRGYGLLAWRCTAQDLPVPQEAQAAYGLGPLPPC